MYQGVLLDSTSPELYALLREWVIGGFDKVGYDPTVIETTKMLANELVVTIGKMHIRLAKEVLAQHGVGEENPLDFYYQQDPVFLYHELKRANQFMVSVPLVADTNFNANHFLRMYKTRHISIGKVIPGRILETHNYARRFIAAINDFKNGRTPESFCDSDEKVKLFEMLKAKTKDKCVLYMTPTQKHSKLYITVHYVPLPV